MKRLYFILSLCLVFCSVSAQQNVLDSLKRALNKTSDDSTTFTLLIQIGELYTFNNASTSIYYINKAATLADRSQNSLWKAHVNYSFSQYYYVLNDYAASLNYVLNSINGLKEHQDSFLRALGTLMLASLYDENGFMNEAKVYVSQTLALLAGTHTLSKLDSAHFFNSKVKTVVFCNLEFSYIYQTLKNIDSALAYAEQANKINIEKQINWNYPIYHLASIYQQAGHIDTALTLFRRALSIAIKENILKDVVDNYNGIAGQLLKKNQSDSAIFYGYKAYVLQKDINYKQGALKAALLLSEAYAKKGPKDSIIKYTQMSNALKDTLFNQEKVRQVQRIAFKEKLNQQELRQNLASQKAQYLSRIKLYLAIGIAAIFLAIAVLLWSVNQNKRKANALLQQEKSRVENMLQQLKATQAQLIQQEKMASLGELTAGIAHEIQNPLNFVNNFSEVNKEMIAEMKEELATGNTQQAMEIANDIEANEEKILYHGKRADAIVKGMLQHSRVSTGQRELTDINALADEYLRLSYHGLRAKDKSFNATLQTDFDTTIGKINIVPQDIGRSLLNLFNNAFYAVMQKNASTGSAGQPYEPTVSVCTKKVGDKILISVKDNGIGIAPKVVDKIFQPFFTTKPTGQGTGLGLSLSYDIVKAHEGSLEVTSTEGVGSEFKVLLPSS
jgi:two-component system NtrC family sensor kinase